MDRPEVMQAIAALRDSGEERTEAKQILAVKDDHVFLWNRRDFEILAISLNEALSPENERIQTFLLTDTPLFEVERIVPSLSGRRICLYGKKGVMCVDLPRRSGKGGRFSGGQRQVTCRSSGVAERFFLSHSRLVVQHALWHPGSASDAHLAVLSSDNFLRFYNVDLDKQTPEQSICLSKNADGGFDNSTSFFGEASLSVRASLGETVVCFAFAPCCVDDDDVEDVCSWPVFVLQGNGEIFCVLTGMGADAKEHRVFGPLSMYPSSPDNYGASDSFCALLCLHPGISSPPLLVVATAAGTVYHCIALARDPEGEDARSQVSQWSTSTLRDDDGSSQLSLYVYESVELEIGLSQSSSKESVDPFEYPLLLTVDPTSPARYFCSHKAGVHCVGLPMVTQLAEMAQLPDDQRAGEFPMVEQDSVVEYLVCTRLSSSSPPAPIMGVAVHYPPTQLLCLLSDFSLQRLPLSSPRFASPPPLLVASSKESPIKRHGNCRELAVGESFEQKVRTMLRRDSTLPRLRTSAEDEPSVQEALEVVTRSTQILREEYIVKQEAVRAEIERRTQALTVQKRSQQSALDTLNHQRHGLREKAADLSEAYEDLNDSGRRLQKRLEVVLQRVQAQVQGSSDAELRMTRGLQELSRRTKDLANALEQVRAKEKYQLRQVQETRRQRAANAASERGSPFGSPATTSCMGENQLNSIKEVLEQDSKEIAGLVATLNLAKRDLAI